MNKISPQSLEAEKENKKPDTTYVSVFGTDFHQTGQFILDLCTKNRNLTRNGSSSSIKSTSFLHHSISSNNNHNTLVHKNASIQFINCAQLNPIQVSTISQYLQRGAGVIFYITDTSQDKIDLILNWMKYVRTEVDLSACASGIRHPRDMDPERGAQLRVSTYLLINEPKNLQIYLDQVAIFASLKAFNLARNIQKQRRSAQHINTSSSQQQKKRLSRRSSINSYLRSNSQLFNNQEHKILVRKSTRNLDTIAGISNKVHELEAEANNAGSPQTGQVPVGEKACCTIF